MVHAEHVVGAPAFDSSGSKKKEKEKSYTGTSLAGREKKPLPRRIY